MRLTCPNCGAQYEVPDEVIPETGRDVQCSNCGDTWFQHHPDHPPEDSEASEPAWDFESENDIPESRAEPEDPQEPEEDETEYESDPGPAPRRELDPETRNVLREEAERERAARATEGGAGLETQPDLGLGAHEDDSDLRSREARARMARLKGEPEDDTPEMPDPDPGTRRNLLPDIDEINSSLNSDADEPAAPHPADADMVAEPRPGGFRRGFMLVVLLAVIGLLIYMFAPQLAQSVPALEQPLSVFVQIVDSARAWLDQTIAGLMGMLDGMSSEGG